MVYMSTIITLTAAGLAASLYLNCKFLKKHRIREAYLDYVIKNLPVGIYLKDINGNFLITNNEFAKISGFSNKELVKMNVKDVFTQKHHKIIDEEDKEIINTQKSLSFERNVYTSKASNHTYSIVKAPVFDKKKNIRGFIVAFKNTDKEKEIHDKKENFIATLTHDLKNPTIAQIRMLDLLLDGHFGNLNSEQKEMLELTQCSCKYMSDLVATMLDTYKCDCGNIKLNPADFDLIELINHLCKGSENLAEEKNQKIFFNHNVKTCNLYADRLQIKRVVVNLLSNAITYGFNNTNIIINLNVKNESIEFSVQNKSRYIPEDVVKNLFKRFTKTEMSHFNKASTSLGLYLSKQIIDLHSGEIYAKSFEDGTCIFGFNLKAKGEIKIVQNECCKC